MVVVLLVLTSLVIVWAMLLACWSSRDGLHPMIYMGPMWAFTCVYRPFCLYVTGGLEKYFPSEGLVLHALLFHLAAIGLFCCGCLGLGCKGDRYGAGRLRNASRPAPRQRLFIAAYFLAMVSIVSFSTGIVQTGGLTAAYGHAKGGATGESGYFGCLVYLSIPAVLLLAMSWRNRRTGWVGFGLKLFFLSPQLIHGVLGSRRGELFYALAALLFAHYVQTGRRPSLSKVLVTLGAIGLAVLLVFSQRSRLYIGSKAPFEASDFMGAIVVGEKVDAGEEFIHSASVLLLSSHNQRHFWGRRIVVLLFVRPIPRQLWPTKYVDTGLEGLVYQSEMNGFSDLEWLNLLHRTPIRGASANTFCDLFLELSYFGLVGCYLLGLLLHVLWKRARLYGGLWDLLYGGAMISAFHMPTQELEAFLVRFLIIAVPATLVWRAIVPPWRMGTAPLRERGLAPLGPAHILDVKRPVL